MTSFNPMRTPAEDLPELLRPLIEEHRDEADRIRRLPEALVAGLRAANVFALNTPHEFGGYELPLVEYLKVLESLGRIDGSTAWVVWNLNFGFGAAFLPPEGVAQIWSREGIKPAIANSGRPGTLTPAVDGFLLSGEWKLVSGVEAADWITLPGVVPGSGDTPPDIRACWVRRTDVTVNDTWHSTGMRGTSSNTVTANAVHVARELTIPFPTPTPTIDRPLYRLPLVHLVFAGCAAVTLGMAQAAVDEVAQLAKGKKAPDGNPVAQLSYMQAALGKAQARVAAARQHLFATAGALDAAAVAGRQATDSERGGLRGAISHAGEVARSVTTAMYEAAGADAAYESSRIARVMRDVQVAAQHANMSAAHYELAGRTVLGLPPSALFV